MKQRFHKNALGFLITALLLACFVAPSCGTKQKVNAPSFAEDRSADIKNDANACPAGYYCVDNTKNSAKPCPAGFFCPSGTADYTTNKCKAGHYCPEGSSTESGAGECDPGYYCPEGSQTSKEIASGEGFYTGRGANEPKNCGAGFYCPDESNSAPQACPAVPANAVYYDTNAKTNECPFACSKGYKFDSSGGGRGSCITASPGDPADCAPGYYCPPSSLNPPPLGDGQCDAGYYCPRGSTTKQGAGPCDGGYFCPKGSSTAQGAGKCAAGYYCPAGSGSKTQNPSGQGFYAYEGSTNKTACAAGFYCPAAANEKPLPCTNALPAFGQFSVQATTAECPFTCIAPYVKNGAICGLTSPSPSISASPSHSPSSSPVISPTPVSCPGGQYRDGSNVCQICPAGNYCTGGANAPAVCQAGYYCPAGSSAMSASGQGYYVSSNGASARTECGLGRYCPNPVNVGSSACNLIPTNSHYTNTTETTASCSYACNSGYDLNGSQCVPSSCAAGSYRSGTGCLTCDAGYYCQGGTTDRQYCPAGSSCPSTGMATPTYCSMGTYCPGGSTSAVLCPVGSYCPNPGTMYGCGSIANGSFDQAGQTASPCHFTCNSGFHSDGTSCVADTPVLQNGTYARGPTNCSSYWYTTQSITASYSGGTLTSINMSGYVMNSCSGTTCTWTTSAGCAYWAGDGQTYCFTITVQGTNQFYVRTNSTCYATYTK